MASVISLSNQRREYIGLAKSLGGVTRLIYMFYYKYLEYNEGCNDVYLHDGSC